MLKFADTALRHDRFPFAFFAVMSALALALALTGQYAYGLYPCVLCQYQRAPFVCVIMLGFAGLMLARSRPAGARICLGLITSAYTVNAVIAAYHSGVERHWWRSFMEGCSIPVIEGDATDVLARISAMPLARCDEIPWIDPILGLSMANWNIVFSALLAGLAGYAVSRRSAIAA